jgi:hypothetical protein
MLYLLGLIGLLILLGYLYKNTTVYEGWHNYNYRNTYNNMFGLFPNFNRSPYQVFDTTWKSGIYSVPHYNTFDNMGEKAQHLYAQHQYLSNLPLMGYHARRSFIPAPPMTLTGFNPILTG